MQTTRRWHQSLAARYGVVMVGFVAVGSLLLVTWLGHHQQEEARRVFVTVSQNDVDFVKRLNLPRSAKLAADLRQLLRMDIHFRNRAGETEPALPPEEEEDLRQVTGGTDIHLLSSRREALVMRLDDAHEMIFIREPTALMLSLWHPATLYALMAFWLFSAVFAWILGQQVVGPARRLTRGLTDFFDPAGKELPETRRKDEIGELARALTQARDDLLIERQRREQSERLALLGRVATGLAHEIKNPLASIQLHAQLMDRVDLDAESQVSLGHLLAEVQVIEGLVNQWLYLARPASPKKQPLELMPLVDETVAMLRPQAAHAGVTMETESRAVTNSRSLGDRLRLQQALRNVILNAIQAMPGGGQLRIFLEAQAGEKEFKLVLEDEGRGFTEAALHHGTELFFSEKEGGMGVGLNVAREIISAHEGKMMLKNHPKGGARVEITLPMVIS
ncbi:ATP-binding protein [Prosthecobacter sp. SYSU 5D2]|uniref:sensor histidine kinase n=1 Tax=Prosthecobacter sp. SYSU 5D2 TaxID=3134134 RepID=UPI0031FE80DA